jgi:hypothetical protein
MGSQAVFFDRPDRYSLTRTDPVGWPEPVPKEIVMNPSISHPPGTNSGRYLLRRTRP